MTPDEAVAAVAQGDCFVVFDGATGEVLSVEPTKTTAEGLAEALARMRGPGPTVGRFFARGTLTLSVIARQGDDCRRIALRSSQSDDLQRRPAAYLVDLLEGRLPLPVGFSFPFEAGWMIPALFQLHRDELTPDLVARIAELHHRFSEEADLIAVYLAGTSGDRNALWAIWPGKVVLRQRHFEAALDAHGRLGESSPAYVDALLAHIEADDMFSVWFPGVTALGRVGQAAGPRSAQVIRRKVLDTEPWIIAVRERALARIESPPETWERCGCDNGYVVDRSGARWRRSRCPKCLGFALTPRAG